MSGHKVLKKNNKQNNNNKKQTKKTTEKHKETNKTPLGVSIVCTCERYGTSAQLHNQEK